MENARSRRAPITASIVVLLLAGCGVPAEEEGPDTAARATPIGPPAPSLRRPDLTLRPARFRAEALDGADELPLPEAYRPERPGQRSDERFDRPERDDEAFGARAEERREADPCFAECGRDRACRMMCLDGFGRADGEDEDCLECGRETGFLGRPELHVAAIIDGKAVVLEWTPIEGARRYHVYGLRWPQAGGDGAVAYSWETRRTRLRVDLEENHVYTFYVVAVGARDDIRSKPSRAVTVRL